MKHAVILTGGKQYKVCEGEVFSVAKLEGKAKDKVEFKEILLLLDDDKAAFGTPYLKDVKVKAEIIEQYKDKKVIVSKFKAKARYRRVKGHRQQLTKIKIIKIEG